MNPTFKAYQVFDKRAKEYQAKYMDISQYQASLDSFCQKVEKHGAAVLDVACGPGNITRYLHAQRPDFKLTGIDLAPQMLALAQEQTPTASFHRVDMREISTLGQKFDGIVCGFGLPYLSKKEAVQFIGAAANLLQPRGILYLSTMEGVYESSDWQTSSAGDRLYVYYHQADYLTQALQQNGFNVLEVQRLSTDSTSETTTDLILIAQT